MLLPTDIVEYAKSVGYHKCGIIPAWQMEGYEARLEERMDKFPETREKLDDFRAFAHLKESYPWAGSVIICSFWYGKYSIPKNLQGRIAKYYLTDSRHNRDSEGYKASTAFEDYLLKNGLRVATDRDFGITALRWAGMKAGIGIVRKNNFFYTEKGSYQYLEAFLIDRQMEYINSCSVKPCPKACGLCIKACPTNALNAPYSMCRNTCVSCLTTWDGWDLRREPLRDRFGEWIYGCDACQDACPFNRNAWTNDEKFPELDELSNHLSNEEIVHSDYGWLYNVLQPKLWYIPKDKIWRYKTNALNAMLNNYRKEYLPIMREACNDPYKEVRDMAAWCLTHIPKE